VIVGLSLLPIAIEYLRNRRRLDAAADEAHDAADASGHAPD
jgi:hypothetical protein